MINLSTVTPIEREVFMIMPIEINGEQFLNTSEAMSYLGVSRTTLDDLVKDGRLKRYKQGIRRVNYFKQLDLDRLLEMREDDGDSEE
jgi:excisionase family DNA binding protein